MCVKRVLVSWKSCSLGKNDGNCMELYLYICKFGGVCCCLTCGVFVVVWTLLTSPGGFGRSILIITPSKQEVRQQRVLIFIPRSSQTRPSRSVKSTKILETMAKEALQEEIFQHKVSKQKVAKDKRLSTQGFQTSGSQHKLPQHTKPKKHTEIIAQRVVLKTNF